MLFMEIYKLRQIASSSSLGSKPYVHIDTLYQYFFVYIMLLTSGQISMGISSFIGTYSAIERFAIPMLI